MHDHVAADADAQNGVAHVQVVVVPAGRAQAIESVQVQPASAGTLAVSGAPVAAMRYRITGAAQPVDVWYAANGDWVGLDALVAGGRKLSYRLP